MGSLFDTILELEGKAPAAPMPAPPAATGGSLWDVISSGVAEGPAASDTGVFAPPEKPYVGSAGLKVNAPPSTPAPQPTAALPGKIPLSLPEALSADPEVAKLEVTFRDAPDARSKALALRAFPTDKGASMLASLSKDDSDAVKGELEALVKEDRGSNAFALGILNSTFIPQLLPEETRNEIKATEEAAPGRFALGQATGTVGQAFAGGAAAAKAVGAVASKAATVGKAAELGDAISGGSVALKAIAKTAAVVKSALFRNAVSRTLTAGGIAAEQNVGRKELGTAVGDVIQQSGGGLVSLAPEILAPPGVAQLLAQPMADLVYDVAAGKIRGQDVGSKEWWRNKLITLAGSAGFALRDVAAGKTFKAEQLAQRKELGLSMPKTLEIVESGVPVGRTLDQADVDAAVDVAQPLLTVPSPAKKIYRTTDVFSDSRKQYQDASGKIVKSSREHPQELGKYKVGDWRVDDFEANYGRTAEQLVEIPVKGIKLSEEDYTVSNSEGRGDDSERYAEWARQGKEIPPIDALEMDDGSFKVSNGHRRVAAAKKAGKDKILAWLSWKMDTGNKDVEGKPIYTAMTDRGDRFKKDFPVEGELKKQLPEVYGNTKNSTFRPDPEGRITATPEETAKGAELAKQQGEVEFQGVTGAVMPDGRRMSLLEFKDPQHNGNVTISPEDGIDVLNTKIADRRKAFTEGEVARATEGGEASGLQEGKAGVGGSDKTTPPVIPDEGAEIVPPMRATDDPAKFKTVQQSEGLNERGTVRVGNPREAVKRIAKAISSKIASRGDLPEEVFQKKLESDHWVNAEAKEIEGNVAKFRSIARKVYGRDRLTDDEVFAIDQVFKGQAAPSTIDERLRPLVQKMRTHTDAMSQRMIDEGVVEGDLAAKITSDMGYYANRAYRVFTVPKYAEKVHPEVRNRAIAYVRDEHVERSQRVIDKLEQRLDDLAGEKAFAQGKGQPVKDIDAQIDRNAARLTAVKAKQNLTDGELDGRIDELLFKDGAPMSLMASGKLGSRRLGILKRRKEIPEEIRALWGEYKDADVNYINSVSKMAHLIANHKFLNDVRAEGEGKFFFKDPVKIGDESYSQPIAAKGSKSMSPLNGLYTTKEIREAFEKFSDTSADPAWLKLLLKVNSVSKYAKTILSPMTHLRNTVGNVGFAVANGHVDVRQAPGAVLATMKDYANMGDEEFKATMRELRELGVVGTGARMGEVRALIKDATQSTGDIALGTGANRGIKKVVAGVEKLYGSEDDLWKIYGYRNELARYRKALPDMPEVELKKKVAGIIRDTYPTYEMIPEVVRAFRRIPFIGPFVSFPAEVIRTSVKTAKLTMSELKDPALRGVGAQRLTGMLVAAGLTGGITAGTRYVTGTDRKKDEANRTFMGPWSQNSQIAYSSEMKDGVQEYYDLGYSDPHSYIKSIVIAAMRGEDLDSKAASMVAEAAAPFFSEGLMTQKLLDISRNSKKGGGQVWNPTDDVDRIIPKALAHFASAITPGAVEGAKRIYLATKGEGGRSGQKYDVGTELQAQLTGFRKSKLDVPYTLKFKAVQLRRDLTEAAKLKYSGGEIADDQRAIDDNVVTRVYDKYGYGVGVAQVSKLLTDNGVSEGRTYSEIQKTKLRRKFSEVINDAMVVGLTTKQVFLSLRDAGMSENDALRMLNAGMGGADEE